MDIVSFYVVELMYFYTTVANTQNLEVKVPLILGTSYASHVY